MVLGPLAHVADSLDWIGDDSVRRGAGTDQCCFKRLGKLLGLPHSVEVDQKAHFPDIMGNLGNRIDHDVCTISTKVPVLLRDDFLQCPKHDRLGNQAPKPGSVKRGLASCPLLADHLGKLCKVLLGTTTDDVRLAPVREFKLCKVGFREKLRTWKFEIEPLSLTRPQFPARVSVLASGPFIEPPCFSVFAVWFRGKHPAGVILHAHMKRVIRKEICSIDPVLAVGKLRNPWHNFVRLLGWNDAQLHLYEDVLQLLWGKFQGRMDRGCRLPTVHNLKVSRRHHLWAVW